MSWHRRRLLDPLMALLQQGLSPRGLAWSVAVGLGAGVSPLIGSSTGLCLLVGTVFRLNQVAMQLANYVAYPLQLLLLIPFIRLGERLFGAARLPLSLEAIQEAMKVGASHALHLFWTSLWHAAVAWLLVAPFASALLALVLTPLFEAAFRRLPRAAA